MKNVLAIAGSDSSGGAGIQADLKTFSAHGVFGMTVITAVTAQNTARVIDVQDITPDMIGKQIDAIFEDIDVDAVKIGMVSKIESIKVIAEKLRKYKPKNIVLDPVMISKSGYALLEPDAIKTLIAELLPLATVVTPNAPEAEKISGITIKSIEDMKKAAEIIHGMGAKNVLVKGGHIGGSHSTDILFDGKKFHVYEAEHIKTKNTHGTGCTLSSAIASNLALGMDVANAVDSAKKYITSAITHSLSIGKGNGPTHHFYELYKKAGILTE
ncbi:MAG: bifunctional hydroxymethylpyrimidine kinase/phosphomethylpyrimidine kinase [Clostridiaceae bacterium]|nr:bifunctional hydroxymethylpyrimidine kinase/phosphomethylpyrimidine kinase [Clostridiaceae bacterium]